MNAAVAKAMTEDELLSNIIKLAQACRWKVAHFRPAKTEKGWRTPVQGDGKGFPDLVMVRLSRFLVVECKSEKAPDPKNEQAEWLEAFENVGAKVLVWRPRHWLSGEIQEVLA